MNDNNLNEMIKKAQTMIQNNQIPDDIKSLINNLQNSNSNNSNNNVDNKTNSFNSANSFNSNNTNNYNNYYRYKNSNNLNNSNPYNNFNSSNNSDNQKANPDTSTPNIDMETLMKLQNIMSKMKNSNDDDMSKLLLSLKPYLRDGKKEKIDEYIQLIKMGKITQFLDLFGGDKK